MKTSFLFVALVLLTNGMKMTEASCPLQIEGVDYGQLNLLQNSGPYSGDWYQTDSTGNSYLWNFCDSLNSFNYCNNAAVCQNAQSAYAYTYGEYIYQTVTVDENSVSFFSNYGSYTGSCGYLRSNITVFCNPNSFTSIVSNPTLTAEGCEVKIVMVSPYACPSPISSTFYSSTYYSTTYSSPSLLNDADASALSVLQDQWGEQLGWEGDAASQGCNWYGVECDYSDDGTYLLLDSLDLGDEDLPGPIPDAIGDFSYLYYLDLSSNNFSGPLPQSLCQLRNLESFYGGESGFTGSIPPCIAGLPNLSYLDLSSNFLTGPMPAWNETSPISQLVLNDNLLSGKLPVGFGYLKYLDTLYLQDNDFEGVVPNLVCILSDYNLQRNRWSCPLPLCCGQHGNSNCLPCFT